MIISHNSIIELRKNQNRLYRNIGSILMSYEQLFIINFAHEYFKKIVVSPRKLYRNIGSILISSEQCQCKIFINEKGKLWFFTITKSLIGKLKQKFNGAILHNRFIESFGTEHLHVKCSILTQFIFMENYKVCSPKILF